MLSLQGQAQLYLQVHRYFYYNSRGSAHETKSHLFYARDVGYIEDQICESLVHKVEEVLFDLNSVINTLRRNLKS